MECTQDFLFSFKALGYLIEGEISKMSEVWETLFGRKLQLLLALIPNSVKCLFVIYVQVSAFYEEIEIHIDYTTFIKNLSVSPNLRPFYVLQIYTFYKWNVPS